jgi:hypothetical protein
MSGRKRPPLKFEQIDRRCRVDILLAGRGEPSAWPADKYPTTHGGKRLSYQERFAHDDKQMMLWAIVLDVEDGKPTPKWAVDALKRALIEMAVGADWKDVFGLERAERGRGGANRGALRARAEKMYAVWDFMQEQRARGVGTGTRLYQAATKSCGVSETIARRYHARMMRHYKQVALGPKTKAL